MRQFFLVLGAVFVIIAGVSPIKRLPSSDIRMVEIGRSHDVVIKAATRRIGTAVRVGIAPDADLP